MSLTRLHLLCIPLGLLAIALAGCNTAASNGYGSGIGAEGGMWPSAPARQNTAKANPDDPPRVPLMVVLRVKSAEGEYITLDMDKVELKYAKQWVQVTNRVGMIAVDALPLHAADKGAAALLYTGTIQKRKYTALRFSISEKKTELVREKTKYPLTVQGTTLTLGEWTPADPDAKVKTNLLTIEIDGTKVKKIKDSATLAAEASTISTALPAGALTGKLDPATPNANVDVYWGNSKTLLGTTMPDALTGAFTVTHLPAGLYRIDVRAKDRKLVEPLKNLISVDAVKATDLKALALMDAGG